MAKLNSPLKSIVRTHPQVIAGLASHKSAGGQIAPGFKPAPALDLKFRGGRTIPDLAFKSFYLGGASWADTDIQQIDAALSGAMADPHLNNVLLQYYPGRKAISSRFLGSEKLATTVGKTFTRDSVNPALSALLAGGKLTGIDFDTTVICLFLPPGAVLDTRAAGGVGKDKDGDKPKARAKDKQVGDTDDEDTSKNGLGGYHGSAHVGATRIYFAVGVYSENVGGKINGIPVWPDPWKNVVATFYHELVEARTDPDVEESTRANNDALLGWYSDKGGEIGDIPMSEAGAQIGLVMIEVKLASGTTAPIQLMWSNSAHGPQGPFA